MENFNNKYAFYKKFFEDSLDEFLTSYLDEKSTLNEAVKYSIIDGGKRVRPVLLYSTASMLNLSLEEVKNISLSIEMIHSYSLIHDDLPCMDNDDYRRGKYSTHKKYGESMGVLAGDSLLNLAFECALLKEPFTKEDKLALSFLSECAGVKGMIKGQAIDLACEKDNKVGEKVLKEIYLNKTAKLIKAPIVIASIISGGKYLEELSEFGENLGYLFQIVDDIMDENSTFEQMGKTPNKDKALDKLTAIKVYGLKGAKEKAKNYYENCIRILKGINNSEFLIEFTNYLYKRNS